MSVVRVVLRYWIPVLFTLGLIFYLSSKTGDEIPQWNIPYLDKIAHFSIYFALGFVVCRALTFRKRTEPRWPVYSSAVGITILLGLAYGLTDEFHQSFVPGRAVELADVVADTIGASFGALLTLPYRKLVVGFFSKSR